MTRLLISYLDRRNLGSAWLPGNEENMRRRIGSHGPSELSVIVECSGSPGAEKRSELKYRGIHSSTDDFLIGKLSNVLMITGIGMHKE